RPVILLHGLFSSAEVNWIKYGTAAQVAAAGFRVIMPDHRGHGDSAKPHDPAFYPRGILARDVSELIAHLGLEDYDLGGFSLGARTIVQAVGEGLLAPQKAILAGMGLRGILDWDRRQSFFRDVIANFETAKRGDPHWLAIQFMKTMKVDRVAAALVLHSFGDAPRAALTAFAMPTLVLIGAEDEDNGSARELAEALPDATYMEIPGTHMSCVTKPEMGRAIADFLVT
ncbi:MAG: alpha/beta fold hydrolase, partial [Pseudomonadota bacterium]